MIFGRTKLELKVGIFVFMGLVILLIAVLLIGNWQTWTSGYHLNFVFNFVNGVKLGAPVRFAGVDVGEVQKIEFIFTPADTKPKVNIGCWLKNGVNIPADSTIWVNTLGLLGEKYIEIMPGQDQNNLLSENQSLTGEDPVPMHEVSKLAKNIADQLNVGITKIRNAEGTVGKLLYEDTLYKELEALVIDIRKNPWKLFIKSKEKK